jgi:hypothetical protein
MASSFKFDDGALRRAAQDAVAKMARDLTARLNALVPQYTGRPIDEVKQAVRAAWRAGSSGGEITDPHLTAFAEQIAGGGKVTVQMKP